MLEDALLDLSHRGDIVLDPFPGSGAALIASEKTGRICRGLELDPLYVDVIIRRYGLLGSGVSGASKPSPVQISRNLLTLAVSQKGRIPRHPKRLPQNLFRENTKKQVSEKRSISERRATA
jgi:DNA methylase